MSKTTPWQGFAHLTKPAAGKPPDTPRKARDKPVTATELPSPTEAPPKAKKGVAGLLDTSAVERALAEISITFPPGTYVEHHPTHKVIVSMGITFVLKPEL